MAFFDLPSLDGAQCEPVRVREGARYACFGDGLCCTDIHAIGPIRLSERARLRVLHDGIVAHDPRDDVHVLVMRAGSGTCIFLEENRCAVHEPLGGLLKPLACKQFPISLTATPEGGRVTTEHKCPCRTLGERPLLTVADALPAVTQRGKLAPVARVGRKVPIAADRQRIAQKSVYVNSANTCSRWFMMTMGGGTFCGAFRFARNEIEFLHEDSFAATFTTWTRTWRLPMSSTVNSAFELTGTVREVGRVGMEWSNADSATRTLAGGGSVTFRNRFPTTPSSITFSALNTSSGFSGSPSSYFADRDGFGVFSYQTMASLSTVWWFGTYTAIA